MNKLCRKIALGIAPPREGKADFEDPQARYELTFGFTTYELSPAQFVTAVKRGHPFCHVFDDGGRFRRKKGYFVSADYIAVDVDNLVETAEFWTPERAAEDTFIRENALFLYTTPSHTPEHPKFRIIFATPERLTDPDEYEKIARYLTRSYPQADQSCWNQTRFFYGGKPGECEVKTFAAQTLAPSYVETAIRLSKTSAVGKAEAPEAHKKTCNRGFFSDKQRQVLDQLLSDVATAEKGRRSEADFSAMVFACKLGLSKSEIWALFRDIGKFAERGETYFENTYSNAYVKAQAEIDRGPTAQRTRSEKADGGAAEKTTADSNVARTIELAKLDERGLAYLFVDELDGEALYNVTSRHWRRFHGGVWEDDFREAAVWEAAESVIARLSEAQREIWRAARENPEPGDQKRVEAAAKELAKAKRKLNTATGIGNVERIARRLCPVEEAEFDTHAMKLNVKNGTLDIGTMEFYAARKTDLITRQAAVEYIPGATAPRFHAFLDAAFDGNWPVVDYFMEFMGLALTGYSPDEFVLAYGLGGNGKTVLFNILSEIFGTYATTVRMEIFLKGPYGGGGKDEYYLTRLHGARFVKAVELGSGTLHESLIKEMTGGGNEHLTARHPSGRPFDFAPTHSLAIIGNHRPRIASADNGIRRRPKLIEFKHDFTGVGRRPQQDVERELMVEAPGILNMLLEGYHRYAGRGGFKHPPEIVAASADFVSQDDTVQDFVRECLTADPGGRVKTGDVYKLYAQYCETQQFELEHKGQRSLNRALRERGMEIARRAEGTVLLNFISAGSLWEPQNNGGYNDF